MAVSFGGRLYPEVGKLRLGTQRATNDYITTINEPSVGSVNGVTVTNVTTLGTSFEEVRSASYFGLLQQANKRQARIASLIFGGAFFIYRL